VACKGGKVGVYISESKQNGHSVYEIRLIHHVDCVSYLAENQAVAADWLFTGLCAARNENIWSLR
jgi:hypothetical protein